MSFDIKFINHACFQIVKDNFSILVDPWFSGRVFNNSWELLRETDIVKDNIDLSKLTHIFISHEHPDHLSWKTLGQIRKHCKQDIEVLVPSRNNTNVLDNLVKMGFSARYCDPYKLHTVEKYDFSFLFLKNNFDSAIVFDIDEKIIFNKNDCEFNESELTQIKNNIFKNRKIDYLFNQFSLAGYYGNKEEVEKINLSKQKHVSDIILAHKILQPDISIPFASFIYFCRESNKYLNEYIVRPEELLSIEENISFFIPYFYENIPKSLNIEKSLINAEKWNKIFDEKISSKIEKTKSTSEEKIIDSFNRFCDSISIEKNYKNLQVPNEIFSLYVIDLKRYCLINFYEDKINFVDSIPNEEIAIVHSYDLDCFFKFPWGADTINITSCFSVKDMSSWKKLLTFKDFCYFR